MQELTTLLDRCREGDALAWETFVRTYQSRLYSLAFHYLRDAEEAKDAAQEVFIKIYRKREDWKIGDTFVSWMLTMTRNACIDRIRRRRARPPARDLEVGETVDPLSHAPDPEERALASDRHALLYRAMGKLSDRNREIILLKDIQGLKFEEIAAMLEQPIGTLKSRSHRARAELALQVRVLDPSYGI